MVPYVHLGASLLMLPRPPDRPLEFHPSTVAAGGFFVPDGEFAIRRMLSLVVLLMKGTDVIDLARMVQVVLRHRRDDPPRLSRFAGMVGTRSQQFAIV